MYGLLSDGYHVESRGTEKVPIVSLELVPIRGGQKTPIAPGTFFVSESSHGVKYRNGSEP